MKKFTKLLEEIDNKRNFRVSAQVEFVIEASNEGEASYIADSTLSSIKNQSSYTINNIDTDELLESTYGGQAYTGKDDDKTPEEIIKSSWDVEFGERMPTSTEKLEFYHDLRKAGFDGILIHKVLKDKLLGQ